MRTSIIFCVGIALSTFFTGCDSFAQQRGSIHHRISSFKRTDTTGIRTGNVAVALRAKAQALNPTLTQNLKYAVKIFVAAPLARKVVILLHAAAVAFAIYLVTTPEKVAEIVGAVKDAASDAARFVSGRPRRTTVSRSGVSPVKRQYYANSLNVPKKPGFNPIGAAKNVRSAVSDGFDNFVYELQCLGQRIQRAILNLITAVITFPGVFVSKLKTIIFKKPKRFVPTKPTKVPSYRVSITKPEDASGKTSASSSSRSYSAEGAEEMTAPTSPSSFKNHITSIKTPVGPIPVPVVPPAIENLMREVSPQKVTKNVLTMVAKTVSDRM